MKACAQQERADLAMLQQILVQESERPHTDVSLPASPWDDPSLSPWVGAPFTLR